MFWNLINSKIGKKSVNVPYISSETSISPCMKPQNYLFLLAFYRIYQSSFNYYLNMCIFLFHVISQKDIAKLHPSSQLILHIVSLYTWYLSLVLPAAFCINKAILNTPYFLDTLLPIFLFKYTLHNHHKIVTHVNTYLV